jgi:hypothetical protein
VVVASCPAGQALQDAAPQLVEKRPVGHSWHVLLVFANRPGPHDSHAVRSAVAWRPVAHGVQVAEAPVA